LNKCIHLKEIKKFNNKVRVCEDCIKSGDTWVHLRICLICGHVGCCDNSKNKHATKHYHDTLHPVIQSYEPGEKWGFCYEDNLFFESLNP
jgi:uncharacterized UBP type Zn finger protein